MRAGVPRFVDTQHYAGSFGLEWLKFSRTQLDSVTGTRISAQRLERCLGFPLTELAGKRVLEVGCGSGRFTEVMLAHGASVCSLDLSEAVEAAFQNIGNHPRSLIVQADAEHAPFAKNAFDVVLCLGVLQHTRDPQKTLRAMLSHAVVGGYVVVDSYAWTVRRVLAFRYVLRQVFKHLPYESAHRLCRALVTTWLPVHRAVRNRLWARAVLSRFSPIASYFHVYPELSDAQQAEFAVLDTIDFYTPKYERLQTSSSLRRLLESVGLKQVSIASGGNGLEARGRKVA